MEPGKRTCACGQEFWVQPGEIDFLKRLEEEGKIEKAQDPKRCPKCRKNKRDKAMSNGRYSQNNLQ